MRLFLFCLIGLVTALPDLAFAQMKLSPKAAPGANEVRYFTSIDGLMDGNADAVLKETRQGKTVTSAVLDVCYPAAKGSDRKDRFVANLAVNGQTLTGTTQSIGDKLPVTVKLVRKPTGDTFEFKGQISVGQSVTEVVSTDNSDLSEKEFQDNQTIADGITAVPKDFTEVSPESIGVRVKLEAALDFLKGLKGQDVEVSLNGLTVSCDALRAGEQTINLSVDPERAAALIAKFKSLPGVVAAGWTNGIVEMERAIRFSAADWRDGDRLNKDKLAAAVSNVLAKTLSAKASSSTWNANTGKLKLTFKRPSQLFPALDLTETIEVSALVAPDKPGGSDRLMLWIGNPVVTTADEAAGPKLNLAEEASGDEEGEQKDDNGSVDALAKEFKGQRWDVDKSAWK
jgi:phenylpyruvate tautomerase PptA (4-oxalocrotonate tautomerase family)